MQKLIRYQHHHLNYKEYLENGLISRGFKINKQTAIKPVTEDFFKKWNTILLNHENSLIQILLSESMKVVIEKQEGRLKLRLIVVKRTANKDKGEVITTLEEIKAILLRDSLSHVYERPPPILCWVSSIFKNLSDQPGLNEQSLGEVLSSQDASE